MCFKDGIYKYLNGRSEIALIKAGPRAVEFLKRINHSCDADKLCEKRVGKVIGVHVSSSIQGYPAQCYANGTRYINDAITALEPDKIAETYEYVRELEF
jgi:hypothetical protein